MGAKKITWVLILSMLLMIRGVFGGQGYDEYLLKAGFIEKIAKYIQWPLAEQGSSGFFLIGVVGKNPFGNKLERFYGGSKINGSQVKIQYFNQVEDIQYCNILFIGGLADEEIARVVTMANRKGILTMGDTEKSKLSGVQITFYTKGDGRLNFMINTDSLKKYGFKVSYHLSKHSKS